MKPTQLQQMPVLTLATNSAGEASLSRAFKLNPTLTKWSLEADAVQLHEGSLPASVVSFCSYSLLNNCGSNLIRHCGPQLLVK